MLCVIKNKVGNGARNGRVGGERAWQAWRESGLVLFCARTSWQQRALPVDDETKRYDTIAKTEQAQPTRLLRYPE